MHAQNTCSTWRLNKGRIGKGAKITRLERRNGAWIMEANSEVAEINNCSARIARASPCQAVLSQVTILAALLGQLRNLNDAGLNDWHWRGIPSLVRILHQTVVMHYELPFESLAYCKPSRRWIDQGPNPLPTPPRTWRKRTGGQLKTWETAIKADLEPLSGLRIADYARWGKGWMKAPNELAQDRRAWSATVRDVVNWIGDAGSTHPGWMPGDTHNYLFCARSPNPVVTAPSTDSLKRQLNSARSTLFKVVFGLHTPLPVTLSSSYSLPLPYPKAIHNHIKF